MTHAAVCSAALPNRTISGKSISITASCHGPMSADIAPETIYSLATGKPLPEWMEGVPNKRM